METPARHRSLLLGSQTASPAPHMRPVPGPHWCCLSPLSPLSPLSGLKVRPPGSVPAGRKLRGRGSRAQGHPAHRRRTPGRQWGEKQLRAPGCTIQQVAAAAGHMRGEDLGGRGTLEAKTQGHMQAPVVTLPRPLWGRTQSSPTGRDKKKMGEGHKDERMSRRSGWTEQKGRPGWEKGQ